MSPSPQIILLMRQGNTTYILCQLILIIGFSMLGIIILRQGRKYRQILSDIHYARKIQKNIVKAFEFLILLYYYGRQKACSEFSKILKGPNTAYFFK